MNSIILSDYKKIIKQKISLQLAPVTFSVQILLYVQQSDVVKKEQRFSLVYILFIFITVIFKATYKCNSI